MFRRIPVLMAGLLLLASPALGDSVADFYKGKQIRIVVGYGPGGQTDLTTRLIAPVLHKYIPGSPRIVVQNKSGGGSALAANTVFNNERRDGTVMAAISSSLVMKQARGVKGIRFDGRKFNWVASAYRANSACAIRLDAGVSSFAEAVKTKKQLIVSSFDKGGLSPPRADHLQLGLRQQLQGRHGIPQRRRAAPGGEERRGQRLLHDLPDHGRQRAPHVRG